MAGWLLATARPRGARLSAAVGLMRGLGFRLRKSQKDEAQSNPSVASASSTQHLSPATRLSVWGKRKTSTTEKDSITEFHSSDFSFPNLPRSSKSPSTPIGSTLGLHLVHQPSCIAPVDIVFVHGLGGDSRATWSKGHDLDLFWPKLWLPFDPDTGNARIFTFGYNASFELLYDMRFGKDKSGQDLGIGKVPIIFVAHSMGGLVVKKAYLRGQNDSQYQHIVRSISAIVFLATPHRGSNLAEILNRVLMVSFQSSRSFIKELKQSSSSIQELNEQFRHVAPNLSIFTFYEMLATTIVKAKKVMVVEKGSALLGYDKEISRGLNADHHGVCKYSSTDDPNYIHVLNALKTLVGLFRLEGNNRLVDDAKDVKNLLAISASPEDDFCSFRSRWMPGTCEWLFDEPAIQTWLQHTPETRVLWFNAPPASGKSILSTHLISYLQSSGMLCQYFFFKFGDHSGRSLSSTLRSISFQVAKDIPDFKHRLQELSNEHPMLENVDSTLIWRRIFESILFKLDLDRPLYWVIDAVDESDSPKALVELLRSLSSSRATLRVILISRKTESLVLAFDRLSRLIPLDLIEKDGNDHNSLDIRKFVRNEIKHMRGTDELKQRVTMDVISRAGGNFLWVRLVVEEILKCHTEESIQETLNEIPGDMNSLYQRMETAISNSRKSDRLLARSLFEWTICAQRSLTLQELSMALSSGFPKFLDLRRTIQDVCGQFILVTQKGQVELVHQTARDYLITTSNSEISINPRKAHELLFSRTITVLMNPKLRLSLTQSQHSLQSTDPFIFYAATSWSYHLRHAHTSSDEALDLLIKFFKKILVEAAKVLSMFVNTYRKLNVAEIPPPHRLLDLNILDLWVIDLVKIVGKFSRHLWLEPPAIYKLVPPLCPVKSILRQQFYQPETAKISVSGISDSNWSDNLAKISLPNDIQAWRIACAGQYIAVQGSTGTIFLWDSYNFLEACTLVHDEPVTAITFNKDGSRLATYGFQSTKLWSIPSGRMLASTSNPKNVRAMAIIFSDNDTKLLTGSDDRVIRHIRVDDFGAGWHLLDPALLKETVPIEGTIINSPKYIAFNGDATQVGVSYRGFPLSVWDLNEGRVIGRCRRATESRGDVCSSFGRWFAVDRFTWNPVSGHIIGVYKDGTIFKWHPVTDENREVRSSTDEVAASPDGKLFVTSDSNGTVKVWNFAYFSVIYQLSSSDLVMGLTFSPDCRRFYDIRGSYINAWESNSLIRFSESEESYSDTASDNQAPTSISQISETYLAQYEEVSALAVSRSGSLYCVGNEEGIVNLHDASTGKSIELIKFRSSLDVTLLAWSEDTSHIAAANLSGDIVVKRLVLPAFHALDTGFEIKILPSPKVNLEGSNKQQLLFNYDSGLLLIMGEAQGVIWGVDDGAVKASTKLTDSNSGKWLRHPTQKQLLLGFGVNDVKVFQWHDFAEQYSLQFQDPLGLNNRPSPGENHDKATESTKAKLENDEKSHLDSTVSKAIFTQDEKHILVQIKHTSTKGRITKRLLIFDKSVFDITGEQKSIAPLTYLCLTPDIIARIEVPLDILAGQRLVFLDRDLWVCTLKLRSKSHEAPKHHYFIPRDWVSSNGLEQCCITRDGILLCPKEDKVAVVKNNLEAGSF
ncbi:hypothetical protein B7463_g7457, partial [Scytalidium lignicola]